MMERQLQWVRSVQEIRGPILDRFFIFLNYFDTFEYYSILVAVVFVWFGLKLGIRLLALLLASKLATFVLKESFHTLRPFVLDPTLEVIKVNGYSFPSGAAQASILLAGFLILYWKSPWRFVIAPIYVLLIGFSRIYLGVHTPLDILGGWVVGVAIFALYLYVDRLILKKWKNMR